MRHKRYGLNQLHTREKQSAFIILAHQFCGVIVWLLAFAAGLSFYFHDIAEAVAIIIVLVINAVIGFVTELRAARSMEVISFCWVQAIWWPQICGFSRCRT